MIFSGDFSFVRIFLKNYRVTMTTTLDLGKYNSFVSQARVSACMLAYFLVPDESLCIYPYDFRVRDFRESITPDDACDTFCQNGA